MSQHASSGGGSGPSEKAGGSHFKAMYKNNANLDQQEMRRRREEEGDEVEDNLPMMISVMAYRSHRVPMARKAALALVRIDTVKKTNEAGVPPPMHRHAATPLQSTWIAPLSIVGRFVLGREL